MGSWRLSKRFNSFCFEVVFKVLGGCRRDLIHFILKSFLGFLEPKEGIYLTLFWSCFNGSWRLLKGFISFCFEVVFKVLGGCRRDLIHFVLKSFLRFLEVVEGI